MHDQRHIKMAVIKQTAKLVNLHILYGEFINNFGIPLLIPVLMTPICLPPTWGATNREKCQLINLSIFISLFLNNKAMSTSFSLSSESKNLFTLSSSLSWLLFPVLLLFDTRWFWLWLYSVSISSASVVIWLPDIVVLSVLFYVWPYQIDHPLLNSYSK